MQYKNITRVVGKSEHSIDQTNKKQHLSIVLKAMLLDAQYKIIWLSPMHILMILSAISLGKYLLHICYYVTMFKHRLVDKY